MKTCTKCKITKPLDAFSKHPGCVGGLNTQCKECKRQITKRHQKSYYADNMHKLVSIKEKYCARCKILKPASTFQPKFYNKDGLDAHCRECRGIIRREHYDSAVEATKRVIRQQQNPVKLRLRQMIASAKIRAKRDNLPFALTFEYMCGLVRTHCPVLGLTFNYQATEFSADSPSLDKFIPSLGYVPGNVTIISRRANTMKQDASLEEVEALAMWMRHQMDNRVRSVA